jgi:hypothetical protein
LVEWNRPVTMAAGKWLFCLNDINVLYRSFD